MELVPETDDNKPASNKQVDEKNLSDDVALAAGVNTAEDEPAEDGLLRVKEDSTIAQESIRTTERTKIYQRVDPIFYLTCAISFGLLLVGLYFFLQHNNRLIEGHLKEIEAANNEISNRITFNEPEVSESVASDELWIEPVLPVQAEQALLVQPQSVTAAPDAVADPAESDVALSNVEPYRDAAELIRLLEVKTRQLDYLASENHELRLRLNFGEGQLPDYDGGSSKYRYDDAIDSNRAEAAILQPEELPEESSVDLSKEQPENQVKDVESLISNAREAFELQKFGVAGLLYSQALQIEPHNRYANLGVAEVAVTSGNTRLAVDRYRHLLTLNPNDQTVFQLMLALSTQDNMIETELRGHIEKYASDTPALYSILGHHLGNTGRWKEANESFSDSLDNVTENQPLADILFNLAVSLEQTGRAAEAVEYYLKALKSTGTASFDRAVVRDRLRILVEK